MAEFFADASRSSAESMEQWTVKMHAIAVKTERETVSMHVITIFTLVFLPGTFVAVRRAQLLRPPSRPSCVSSNQIPDFFQQRCRQLRR